MKKLITALILIAACTTEPATDVSPLEETCGPAPVFPEFAVAFPRMPDGRLMALITSGTYNELVEYRLDSVAWQECVLETSRQ